MTSFSFIRVNGGFGVSEKNRKKSFLTVTDTSKNPRYVCFTERLDALHCITYISSFRSQYGYYPVIDFSKEDKRHEIKIKTDSKKFEPSTIARFFTIETYDEKELDEICSKNSINLFCIHSFGYLAKENNMELMIQAQELNAKPDLTKFKENLNDILYK